MSSKDYIKKIYKTIKESKAGYGIYRKTLFHLHTPASFDYKLQTEWEEKDYKKCSEADLIKICYNHQIVSCYPLV